MCESEKPNPYREKSIMTKAQDKICSRRESKKLDPLKEKSITQRHKAKYAHSVLKKKKKLNQHQKKSTTWRHIVKICMTHVT